MSVTFIIPSIGRESLKRSLQSLECQTDQDWKAIVCFDKVEPTITPNDKVTVMRYQENQPHQWRQGEVRNHAIKYATTPLAAMLDDDDTVVPNYVELLKRNIDDVDVVVFQMRYQDGRILPTSERDVQKLSRVGISFAFKTELAIKFMSRKCEDYFFLNEARRRGKKIKFVPQVTYLVKH